jgi:hypothetical protein
MIYVRPDGSKGKKKKMLDFFVRTVKFEQAEIPSLTKCSLLFFFSVFVRIYRALSRFVDSRQRRALAVDVRRSVRCRHRSDEPAYLGVEQQRPFT